MQGGQETTLVWMMMPLLHHGMIIVGLPYTEPELNATRSGGTPYGATHASGTANDRPLADEETKLAFAPGKRLAGIARKLATGCVVIPMRLGRRPSRRASPGTVPAR